MLQSTRLSKNLQIRSTLHKFIANIFTIMKKVENHENNAIN